MKILYDSDIFLNQKAGGISRYFYELFDGLKHNGRDVKIAGRFVKNTYLLSNQQYRKAFFYDPTASFSAFNKIALRRALKKCSPDTVFHPSNAHDCLTDIVPEIDHLVFTIHDMIVEKNDIHLGDRKRFYAGHARKIIAVSETTKRDIVNLFGTDAGKIEVVYHGSSLNPRMAVKPKAPLPDRFLLYVGSRNGFKNFRTFVTATAELLKKQPDLYLVCAGKGLTKNEKTYLNDLHVLNKVLIYSNLNDNELSFFYGKATAFVFPSLYEGFGIPILEAWACGTPVILSDNDCFNEVAAEAGAYFNPRSEDSIRECVARILADPPSRDDLIRKGTSRLNLFSWKKTVEQTFNIYQSLL